MVMKQTSTKSLATHGHVLLGKITHIHTITHTNTHIKEAQSWKSYQN